MMNRKYLEGKFTPSDGLPVPADELSDAKFVFNESYSDLDFDLIGVVDLWSGGNLLIERYAVCTLPAGPYEDIETSMLKEIKSNLSATDMDISVG